MNASELFELIKVLPILFVYSGLMAIPYHYYVHHVIFPTINRQMKSRGFIKAFYCVSVFILVCLFVSIFAVIFAVIFPMVKDWLP